MKRGKKWVPLLEPQARPRPALALASGPHLSPRDHSKHQLNQWFSCFWRHFGVKSTIPNHPKAKETNGFLAFWMISSSFHSPRTSQKGNETNGFLLFESFQGKRCCDHQPLIFSQKAITQIISLPFYDCFIIALTSDIPKRQWTQSFSCFWKWLPRSRYGKNVKKAGLWTWFAPQTSHHKCTII